MSQANERVSSYHSEQVVWQAKNIHTMTGGQEERRGKRHTHTRIRYTAVYTSRRPNRSVYRTERSARAFSQREGALQISIARHELPLPIKYGGSKPKLNQARAWLGERDIVLSSLVFSNVRIDFAHTVFKTFFSFPGHLLLFVVHGYIRTRIEASNFAFIFHFSLTQLKCRMEGGETTHSLPASTAGINGYRGRHGMPAGMDTARDPRLGAAHT